MFLEDSLRILRPGRISRARAFAGERSAADGGAAKDSRVLGQRFRC